LINIGRITVRLNSSQEWDLVEDIISAPTYTSEIREVISTMIVGDFSTSFTASYKIENNFCFYSVFSTPDIASETGSVIGITNLPFSNTATGGFSGGNGVEVVSNSNIRSGSVRRANDDRLDIRKYDGGSMGGGVTGVNMSVFWKA
jgi:hypothetical protein